MSRIKRLYRSTRNRFIAGICSGLSDYFNLDVNLIRLIYATIVFIWPGAALAYLLMWFIIPREVDTDVPHAAAA